MMHPLFALRRWRRHLVAAISLGAAVVVWAALPAGFSHHGNFQQMVRSGDTAGRVALAALPQQPGFWGVGATAGLRGELIVVDGRLLVSHGSDAQGRVAAPAAAEQALLFAGAQVLAWRDVPVPQDMDAPAFEAFLRRQAVAAGLLPDQPFVFRVEGRFPHLLWHVVTGEAPAGQGGGHGGGKGGGQETGHAGGGHANSQSGQRLFRQPGASGQLVGVYSGAELEGVVSHPGERLHLHFIDPALTVSGHVDRFSIAAGAVLKLPQP